MDKALEELMTLNSHQSEKHNGVWMSKDGEMKPQSIESLAEGQKSKLLDILRKEIEDAVDLKYSEADLAKILKSQDNGGTKTEGIENLSESFLKSQEYAHLHEQILKQIEDSASKVSEKHAARLLKKRGKPEALDSDASFASDRSENEQRRFSGEADPVKNWGGGFSLFDLDNLPEPINGPALIEKLASNQREEKIEALVSLKEADGADYWMHEMWERLVEGIQAALEADDFELKEKAMELCSELFQKVGSNQASHLLICFLQAVPLRQRLDEEFKSVSSGVCHKMLNGISEHLIVLEESRVVALLQEALPVLHQPHLAQVDPSACWVVGFIKNVPMAIWGSFLKDSDFWDTSTSLCQELLQKSSESPVLVQVLSFLGKIVAFFRGDTLFTLTPPTVVTSLLSEAAVEARRNGNDLLLEICSQRLQAVASACKRSGLFEDESISNVLELTTTVIQGFLEDGKDAELLKTASQTVHLIYSHMMQSNRSLVQMNPNGDNIPASGLMCFLDFFAELAELIHSVSVCKLEELLAAFGNFVAILFANPLVVELLWKQSKLELWVQKVLQVTDPGNHLLQLCQTQFGVWVLIRTSALWVVCESLIKILGGLEDNTDPLHVTNLQYMVLEVLSTSEGFGVITSIESVKGFLWSCYQDETEVKSIGRWLLFALLRCESFLEKSMTKALSVKSNVVLEVIDDLWKCYVEDSEDVPDKLPAGVDFNLNQVSILRLIGQLCLDGNFRRFAQNRWDLAAQVQSLQVEKPYLKSEAPEFFSLQDCNELGYNTDSLDDLKNHCISIQAALEKMSKESSQTDKFSSSSNSFLSWLVHTSSRRSKMWTIIPDSWKNEISQVEEAPFFNWFEDILNLVGKIDTSTKPSEWLYLNSNEHYLLKNLSCWQNGQQFNHQEDDVLQIPRKHLFMHLLDCLLSIEGASTKICLKKMGWSLSSFASKLLLGSFAATTVHAPGASIQQNIINISMGPDYCLYQLAYLLSTVFMDMDSYLQITQFPEILPLQQHLHIRQKDSICCVPLCTSEEGFSQFFNCICEFQQKYRHHFQRLV